MLFIKQRTLLAGTAARRTCLLSLTATVTAAAAEAAHTTHTMARGHQARRHEGTTRRHEGTKITTWFPKESHTPRRLLASSLPLSFVVHLPRFVCVVASSRLASHRSASAFLVHNASESDNATALLLLPQSLSLPLAAVVTISGNSFSPACAVRVPSAHC